MIVTYTCHSQSIQLWIQVICLVADVCAFKLQKYNNFRNNKRKTGSKASQVQSPISEGVKTILRQRMSQDCLLSGYELEGPVKEILLSDRAKTNSGFLPPCYPIGSETLSLGARRLELEGNSPTNSEAQNELRFPSVTYGAQLYSALFSERINRRYISKQEYKEVCFTGNISD